MLKPISSVLFLGLFTIFSLTNAIFEGENWKSGIIDLTEDDDDMFYILFNSRRNPQKDPLVMWLTGGPGCSSELALFYENGPFGFNETDRSLIYNPYSWNNISNLLFVDNPVGTGFSNAG